MSMSDVEIPEEDSPQAASVCEEPHEAAVEKNRDNDDNDDQAADDRIAEAFRKEFMNAVSERQRKKTAPSQAPTRVPGGKKEEELNGPKLAGSRSARAAMRDNLRHPRVAGTPGRYTTVDTPSSSKPGNQRFTEFGALTEWIDGATIQTTAENGDGEASEDSTGFAWDLYHHTLELFSLLIPLILARPGLCNNREHEKSLKGSLGRLFLWGDGFRGGKLETVLHESENLRESIIESLAAIAKILLFSK
jgi:hypothetical protein